MAHNNPNTNTEKLISNITDDDELHLKALEQFSNLEEADNHNRIDMLDDLKFVYNVEEGQWSQSVRNDRTADGRPCLTSNKLRKHVAQVANRERDQRISAKVFPVDDNADPKTAEIITSLIRQIEFASNADEIYTTAGEFAIAGGTGYWRIVTKELSDAFEQEVFIQSIDNPFSVHLDQERNYGFIRQVMTHDEFNNKYPDANINDDFDYTSIGEDYTLWYENDKIFVAEYFYKVIETIEIAEVINPFTQESIIIEFNDKVTREQIESLGYQIVRTKKKEATKVKWAKLSGHTVLEKGDWVGNEIPIIEVKGDHVNIAGKVYRRSLIRDAKDPQRMYNYSLTHNTEVVQLQPKAPYMVTAKQIKGHEDMWNRANTKNDPYIIFNGKANDKPRREIPPQPANGSTTLMQFANDDIMDTTGQREASFGEKSNERTGVAIQQRANRSDFSTFHFPDNFRRAIMETARQLTYIIPKIYDTQRTIRITGEEGSQAMVIINQAFPDPLNPGKKIIINDISYGKYDVVEGTKIWSTRRQEQEAGMVQIASSSPDIALLLLPDIAKSQDWPGHEKLAARIEQFIGQRQGGQQQPPQGSQLPA